MKRSYFVPMVLFGGVAVGAGLYGLRAARIALEDYYEQRRPYVRKTVLLKLDSKTLLQSLGPEQALLCENMRSRALSATFVGLVFIVWAFDRRSMYVRLKATEPGESAGSMRKAMAQIRSIAFCALLLLFAVGAAVHMNQIVSEWVNHMRIRSRRLKNERVRAFLEEKGIPVTYISWGSGSKGWKSVSLAGPEVKDISALAKLPIARLELINTQVTDLNPLNKSALRSLSLERSKISDISPLAGTKIGFLNLAGTDVSDLRPLTQMPELARVRLSRQQIVDNLELLGSLDIVVEEVPEGPSLRTGGQAWQMEYESTGVSGIQRP